MSGKVPRDFDSVWGNKDAQSKITLEGGVLTAPKHDGTGGAYYPPGSPGFHSNLQELHFQALTEGHVDKNGPPRHVRLAPSRATLSMRETSSATTATCFVPMKVS